MESALDRTARKLIITTANLTYLILTMNSLLSGPDEQPSAYDIGPDTVFPSVDDFLARFNATRGEDTDANNIYVGRTRVVIATVQPDGKVTFSRTARQNFDAVMSNWQRTSPSGPGEVIPADGVADALGREFHNAICGDCDDDIELQPGEVVGTVGTRRQGRGFVLETDDEGEFIVQPQAFTAINANPSELLGKRAIGTPYPGTNIIEKIRLV